MECRLRWRLCRSPGILPALQRQSSNPFFQDVVRQRGRRSLTAPHDGQFVLTCLSWGEQGGGASFCLCYARDSHPLAPFVQPSLPLPLDHKSFHDRKSRGAPISSARAMASSFLSQHVQVPGLFSFSARYPSFNDLGPTRLPREWRLSGSANDLVSSTTKCGNFWTDRSSRERLS